MQVEENRAGRQYVRTLMFWMMLYVALVVGLSTARNHHLLVSPWSWIAALTPSIPIGGVMVAVLRYMRDSDEYIRALTAKQLVIALLVTQVLCSAWGFMEIYAGAEHVPLYLVVPIYWGAFAAIKPFVRTSS